MAAPKHPGNEQVSNAKFMEGLVTDAEKAYPFLENNKYNAVYGERDHSLGKIETWPVGEEGAPARGGKSAFLRPAELPIDVTGVEVYSRDTTPKDLAADVFSHGGGLGEAMGTNFQKTLSPVQINELQRQYLDFNGTLDEGSPNADERAITNATSSLLRTAAFGQGGPDAVRGLGQFNFTPEQSNIVAQAKGYITSGKSTGDGLYSVRTALGLE